MNEFTNNPQSKLFHTSAYAQVASGQSMGASDPKSFSQRMAVNRNRQVVGGYHNSMVIHAHRRTAQQPRIDIVKPVLSRPEFEQTARSAASLPARTPLSSSRPAFREPPSRYNPYA